MGCFTDDASEQTREVRLIAHAAAQGNGTQRFVRCQHQALSQLDAASREISVRRDTESRLERPTKMADAETQQSRELFNTNPFGEMRINMRRNALCLPQRQAAPQLLRRAAIEWLGSRRWTLRVAAQKREGARDEGFGSLAVTSSSAVCGIDQLCRSYQVTPFPVAVLTRETIVAVLPEKPMLQDYDRCR